MSNNNPFVQNPVSTLVQQAITTRYPVDPVMPEAVSHFVSSMASIPKRHGNVLETDIGGALVDSGRYHLLRHVRLPITRQGRAAAEAGRHMDQIPFEGPIECHVEADQVSIETASGHLVAAQIKRGNGRTETAKARRLEADLRAAQPTLISYVAQTWPEFEVRTCAVRIIDVYGLGGFDPSLTILGSDLDIAFGVPVRYRIEMTALAMRAMICGILPQLLAPMLEAGDLLASGGEMPTRSRASLIGLDDDA